jgi:hypothetical protein
VFEGVIEPKLEDGEIQEKPRSNKRATLQGKERSVSFAENEDGKRQRLEMQEAALADWEAKAERQNDAFIFEDKAELKAM